MSCNSLIAGDSIPVIFIVSRNLHLPTGERYVAVKCFTSYTIYVNYIYAGKE